MLTELWQPYVRISALQTKGEVLMAKKAGLPKGTEKVDPAVAAALTGIIYQAKLFNRQARVNVPEDEVIIEVISLWRIVTDTLNNGTLPPSSS
jgi:hypothetical protein